MTKIPLIYSVPYCNFGG